MGEGQFIVCDKHLVRFNMIVLSIIVGIFREEAEAWWKHYAEPEAGANIQGES